MSRCQISRLGFLRTLKADWQVRERCPVCKGTGDDEDDPKENCINCDGVGVVPNLSWEEAHPSEAKELAWLESKEAWER